MNLSPAIQRWLAAQSEAVQRSYWRGVRAVSRHGSRIRASEDPGEPIPTWLLLWLDTLPPAGLQTFADDVGLTGQQLQAMIEDARAGGDANPSNDDASKVKAAMRPNARTRGVRLQTGAGGERRGVSFDVTPTSARAQKGGC